MRALRLLAAGLAATTLLGCASGPDPVAFQNRVFYEQGQGGTAQGARAAFERPYPPLDLASDSGLDYVGVQVLGGSVRLSRPENWTIRRASNAKEQRFIEYVSPNQIIFAVYERIESPRELWRVVMQRYEEELEESGGVVLGKAAAASTWNAQARVYEVKRPVFAAKAPFVNYSREYLARSDHRLVLIQVVRPSESLEPISDEMLRVIETLQVL